MRRTGYTLLELLATAVVVGLLAAASISYLGRAVERERWDAARDVLFAIYTGEQMYIALNSGASPPTYWPSPPPATFGSCWTMVGPPRDNCMNAWRTNIYIDDPSDSLVEYGVSTTVDAPPLRTQRFRAVARRLVSGVSRLCMTIDESRTVAPFPAPMPNGCTAGWPRP